MKDILVTLPLSDLQKIQLEAISPERNVKYRFFETVTDEDLHNTEIIIGNVPKEILAYAYDLKWFQLQSAGADYYLRDNFLPENVIVTNASGSYDLSQAEFVLGTLLAVCKNLNRYRDNQICRLWSDWGDEIMISGSTCVIVGMGQIGGRVGELLHHMGAYIIGITRSGKDHSGVADEIYPIKDLDEQLERADIVILMLPHTDETENMFDRKRFGHIRNGAVLVNAGRGRTLNESALAESLKSGRIAAAALDVFEEEPLPEDSELWEIDNLLITPHVAGRDFLPIVLNKTFDLALDNLKRYERHLPLHNLVDREVGYRNKYR